MGRICFVVFYTLPWGVCGRVVLVHVVGEKG